MQSVTLEGFEALQKKLDGFPEAMREARGAFFEQAGEELLDAVRQRIGGSGRVGGVQERYLGSGRGYAAVRARADTFLDGYAAGYITNALENGHDQTPGRYVPAIGKRLKEKRAKGKYMYQDTSRAELRRLSEEGAREIERRAMAYLEGRDENT